MSTLVITIISLCAIGVVSAVILYFVAQKFKVEEDPRIDIVEGLLPGANCGGCGLSKTYFFENISHIRYTGIKLSF